MTLLELIASARRKAFDTGTPGLIAKPEWIEYANEGEREACRRARLIADSRSSLCTLDIEIGEAVYGVDPRIIRINRVQLASKTSPTPKIRQDDLDCMAPGWETQTGEIEAYNLDSQSGSLVFYRIPTVVDTATLTVVRLPLEDMSADGDEPEIKPAYHLGIVNWKLYKFYSCDDAEVTDPRKAEKYEGLFAQEFGPKSSAIEERWITTRHGYGANEGLL